MACDQLAADNDFSPARPKLSIRFAENGARGLRLGCWAEKSASCSIRSRFGLSVTTTSFRRGSLLAIRSRALGNSGWGALHEFSSFSRATFAERRPILQQSAAGRLHQERAGQIVARGHHGATIGNASLSPQTPKHKKLNDFRKGSGAAYRQRIVISRHFTAHQAKSNATVLLDVLVSFDVIAYH